MELTKYECYGFEMQIPDECQVLNVRGELCEVIYSGFAGTVFEPKSLVYVVYKKWLVYHGDFIVLSSDGEEVITVIPGDIARIHFTKMQ